MEMFDFFLFWFDATCIAQTFFPAGDEFAALMLTCMTFGAGLLMRPLGAILLGAYVDRVGRRKGLIVTLGLLAAGPMLIALVPGYATIGYLAPALVLSGRLLLGCSAGASDWAACPSTWPRWRRRAARACMSVGSQAASRRRSPLCSIAS